LIVDRSRRRGAARHPAQRRAGERLARPRSSDRVL